MVRILWRSLAPSAEFRQRGRGERFGVGERDHVTGALDQGVLDVRHPPPDDVADRAIDRGCL